MIAALLAVAAAAADPAPPADANLIVYRDVVAPMLFKVGVEVDGRPVAALPNHRYLALHLAPGEHSLVLRWPRLAMQAGDAIPLPIAADRTSYVQVTPMGSAIRPGRLFILSAKTLVTRDAETGRADVARCCRYQPVP